MIASPSYPTITDAPAQERFPRMRFYDAARLPWCPLAMSGGSRWEGQTATDGMIVAMMSGEITATTSNERQPVRGGRMILIPPDTAYTLESPGPAQAMACTITSDSLSGYLFRANQPIVTASLDPLSAFRTLPFGRQLGGVIAQTQSYINRGLGTETLLAIKQQEFFCLLSSVYTPEELTAFLAPMLGGEVEFRTLVSEHWFEAGNVQRLANRLGLSTSGFIKKFHRVYGQPPYQWMQERKAELVLREVRAGGTPLKGIAHRYGFRSYQHFSDFCKRYFGARPTDLRNCQGEATAARAKARRHNPIPSKINNSV